MRFSGHEKTITHETESQASTGLPHRRGDRSALRRDRLGSRSRHVSPGLPSRPTRERAGPDPALGLSAYGGAYLHSPAQGIEFWRVPAHQGRTARAPRLAARAGNFVSGKRFSRSDLTTE